MGIKELLLNKRAEILTIAAKYGASNLRVFGSVARGEATRESDIDFLVELSPERTLLDQIGLTQDLEKLLGCKIDVAELNGVYELIRDQILREALPL